MTTNVADFPGRRVPADTFPVRLAIIRAERGWNYDQAAAATGINSETWRLWEKGKRRCTDLEGVARTLERAAGYSYEWVMIGGPLRTSGNMPDPGLPRLDSNQQPFVYMPQSERPRGFRMNWGRSLLKIVA